jgi:hypothetical protein
MANVLFDSFLRDQMNGSIDLDTDTIRVLLVTAAYTPNRATHTKRSDITNEVVGTGYTAGGAALANKTVTADTTNHRGVFDADDASWAASTITARAAVLYKARGGASSSDELIGYVDFGANVVSTAGNFLITWSVDGILYFAG